MTDIYFTISLSTHNGDDTPKSVNNAKGRKYISYLIPTCFGLLGHPHGTTSDIYFTAFKVLHSF
jgi:hypothetical protein